MSQVDTDTGLNTCLDLGVHTNLPDIKGARSNHLHRMPIKRGLGICRGKKMMWQKDAREAEDPPTFVYYASRGSGVEWSPIAV